MPIGPWEIAILFCIVGLPVLLGLFFAIFLYTRNRAQQRTDASAHQSPLDVLKTRYARGEIDAEEYEERRKRLLGEADRQ